MWAYAYVVRVCTFFVTAVALVCDDRLENLPYYTGVDVGFLLGFGIGAKKAMAKQ